MLVAGVLVVGNPWLNKDLQPANPLFRVMATYPRWLVDPNEVGLYLFWLANLRTMLFVVLAIAGLARVSSWIRESASGAGVFVAVVGVIELSAVVAGLAAEVIVSSWLASPFPNAEDFRSEYFLDQLSVSASFGVLSGLALGAIVVAQRYGPTVVALRPDKGQSNAPKSFW
jgi:hypothetical protein